MFSSQNPFGLPFSSFSPENAANFFPKFFEPMGKMTEEAFAQSSEYSKASVKSMQDMSAAVLSNWKEQVDLSVKAGKKLSKVETVEDAMKVQSDYLKSCFETQVKNATEMTSLYTESMKTAFAPFEKKA